MLNIEAEIGNWYCYPKKSSLLDTKIYVFIESKDNFLVSFNVSPESLTWDSYCISIKLIEFQSFIKALNTVNKGYTIKKSGILSRIMRVDATYKYTMYEKVFLWKILISIKMITISAESLAELIQDFKK